MLSGRTSFFIALIGGSLAAFAQKPAVPVQPAIPDGSGIYRFQTFGIADDPRHIAGEAYRILAPIDWTVQANVFWKNAAVDPAAPWVKLAGPAHHEMGVLPPGTFIWNPKMLGSRFHTGSFYNGAEVQPPMDPVQCIKTIVIGRYLHELASADVVKQESLPELAEAGRLKYPGPEYKNAVFQAGKMRFEFQENGVAMEADVYVLTAAIQSQAGQTVSTIWTADEIRYSKAPKGTLDAQLPLFQTVMFSLRPNLQWWAKLQRVSHELGRLQMQANDPAAARIMQQLNTADRQLELSRERLKHEPISDDLRKGYQARLAIMDRVNARWDDGPPSVEVYHNPSSGDNVELPSGYSAAWANQTGQYVVSGSANYDPNSGSDGSWTKLEKVKP